MKTVRRGTLIVLVCTMLGGLHPSQVSSDAIIITKAMTASTIAEFSIEENVIRVDLEIGLRDLPAFRNLLPAPLYEKLGLPPSPLSERLAQFFNRDLTIRAGSGQPLPGRVEQMDARQRIQRDDVTGQPLPVKDEDGEPVVYARLVYPFSGRPNVLTFSPPTGGGDVPTAEIGFIVYHRELPVNDFRYLGTEETLRLNWEDPWFSKFDNRNLWRQFDSPVSAFLYVEPYEVRKEIVLRPKDLQQWTDLGLEGKQLITVEEQEEIKRKAVEFLGSHNPGTIDGQPVEGTLDRVHFIYRNLRTSGVIDPPRDLAVTSATLGVIFYYPTDGLPQEVSMEWEFFSERLPRIPSSATDEAGALPYFLSPEDNVLTWKNFLKNPTIPGLVAVQEPPKLKRLWFVVVSLLSVGALILMGFRYGKPVLQGQFPSKTTSAATGCFALIALLTAPQAVRPSYVKDDQAAAIVKALLENVYRSFDVREESVIYDSLEKSAAGDLLTEIYLETRRSLELENQGGARAKVKEVEMIESSASLLVAKSGSPRDRSGTCRAPWVTGATFTREPTSTRRVSW